MDCPAAEAQEHARLPNEKAAAVDESATALAQTP
jgi:hypothetical protein